MRESNIPAFWGAVVAGLMIGLGYGLGLPGIPNTPWVVLVAALLGGGIGKLLGVMVIDGAGRSARAIHAPGGAGGYKHTYSEIDALEAKGAFLAAAEAWDDAARDAPSDAWPLIRAGEIRWRRLDDAPSALERFSRARERGERTPDLQLFAAQKVIDLYLGPLRDEGRAMVELRRLIERHPASREAEFARAALRRIKSSDADPPD